MREIYLSRNWMLLEFGCKKNTRLIIINFLSSSFLAMIFFFSDIRVFHVN